MASSRFLKSKEPDLFCLNDLRVGINAKTKTIGTNINKCGSHLRERESISPGSQKTQLSSETKVASLSNLIYNV